VEVRQPDRGSVEDVKTIAVLGSGAVGGALAVPLSLAGARVICIARPHTAAAIAHEGLTLDRCGEELQVHPEVTYELDDDVDLLLVTVKAPALEDALQRIAAECEVVLPLINGLEHVAVLRERFGERVVVGSIGRLEAFRESPARIVQTTPRPVLTMTAPVDVFDAAWFDVHVVHDERRVLWEKLARVAPLAAVTAITQQPVGDLRTDAEWRARLEAAIGEVCAVASAEGVVLDPAAEWEIIDAMPATLTTSTARDVAAGRPSELDAITGAVVRAARRLGVQTPTLEELLEEACRVPSH
jgi:2-dehydropantoate 2-reductase